MRFQANVQREMTSIAFCIAGLSFTVVGFFIIADKCNLSVVLSIFVGSGASMLNCYLRILTTQISPRYDQKKAIQVTVLLNIFRIFLMGTIASAILLVPVLHDLIGILAMFFSQISRIIISKVKD